MFSIESIVFLHEIYCKVRLLEKEQQQPYFRHLKCINELKIKMKN